MDGHGHHEDDHDHVDVHVVGHVDVHVVDHVDGHDHAHALFLLSCLRSAAPFLIVLLQSFPINFELIF